MCVIFVYANSHPEDNGYKLILASNRDEYFARPTRPLVNWPLAEHAFGGVDMEPGREGGTWLAIGHKDGIYKVGALLNLTGEPRPHNVVAHNHILQTHHKSTLPNNNNHCDNPNNNNNKCTAPTTATTNNEPFLLGRGMIVTDYVANTTQDFNIDNYNVQMLTDSAQYSAFNFLSMEIGPIQKKANIKLLSNMPTQLTTYEEKKCYGFGNSLPKTPFEKVRYGRQEFEKIVTEYGHSSVNVLYEKLQQLLKNPTKFWPDAELKRRAPSWGEGLSSLNVHIPEHEYGSRTHSVILVNAMDEMHFIEETMTGLDPSDRWHQTHIKHSFA